MPIILLRMTSERHFFVALSFRGERREEGGGTNEKSGMLFLVMAVVLSVQAVVSSPEEAVLASHGPEVLVKEKQWQPHPIV